ncbi:MAG TPA: LuxR C-terminal-related transcriptional regulator [Tepidisphaeraceae bacterium]|nr:LuxR C-terminal-related transcriptional regulator [Tepidisphaeraceae bacterium]
MCEEISQGDISAVIRLVREVCDRWDDPASWRAHLLDGICKLLDAQAGMMLTEYGGKLRRFGRLPVISVVGLPAEKRSLVQPAVARMEQRPYEDVGGSFLPGITRLYDDLVRQGWVTAARSQMVDDQTYHSAPHYLDFRKPLDWDDYVVSIRMVDFPKRPEGISIDRRHGAPRFGPREVTLLKLLHDEIAPLVGTRLATEDHLCRDGLSIRLRQTLSLLLEGLSEKQAARKLGLSDRTVHDYVTMLYKHFDVCSRAELLAYFIRRVPQPRTIKRSVVNG